MPLAARSVADFYLEFITNLESLGIQVKITTDPVEVDNGIPFPSDRVHADHDPRYVIRCWGILLGVSRPGCAGPCGLVLFSLDAADYPARYAEGSQLDPARHAALAGLLPDRTS